MRKTTARKRKKTCSTPNGIKGLGIVFVDFLVVMVYCSTPNGIKGLGIAGFTGVQMPERLLNA